MTLQNTRPRRRRSGLNLPAATAGLLGLLTLIFSGSASAGLPPGCSRTSDTVTCTYASTGATQTFTVPGGVTSISFDVAGAQGAPNFEPGAPNFEPGGRGAQVRGTLAVTSGEVLTLTVAGQGSAQTGGFGGGADGGLTPWSSTSGRGGGGASRLAVGDSTLVVAAGGGGAAGNGGAGGDSGSPGSATRPPEGGGPGGAGTESVGGGGGAGGTRSCSSGLLAGLPGSNGGLDSGGAGGSGAGGSIALHSFGGGGGGGGYYGGGGGGGGYRCGTIGGWAGGGGGGSSYIDAAVTDATLTDGAQAGNGSISLSYVNTDSSPPVDDPAPPAEPGSTPPANGVLGAPAQPAIGQLRLASRCVRPSRSGRVRIRMSLRTARPGPLQIRVDRAVGGGVRRSCPSPNPQRRFSGRFRNVATLSLAATRPVSAAAIVARRLTLNRRLAPGLYRISVRAQLDHNRFSRPVRRYLRVLGRPTAHVTSPTYSGYDPRKDS